MGQQQGDSLGHSWEIFTTVKQLSVLKECSQSTLNELLLVCLDGWVGLGGFWVKLKKHRPSLQPLPTVPPPTPPFPLLIPPTLLCCPDQITFCYQLN